jgi:hypothetical protein
LGFNEYRMRSAEAMGKHWCLVFVANSLLHLTCLRAVSDRTKGLTQSLGTTVSNRGAPCFWGIFCLSYEPIHEPATWLA